ncbi:hypothetical protein ACIA5D_51730 [Actinoplanes sp. NPDC051513]|uniref:hypothetical protein n=1 Tax=Actinoplanes sp. NPDC051513 TaxID=3363908 RepID=UPI0037B6F29D
MSTPAAVGRLMDVFGIAGAVVQGGAVGVLILAVLGILTGRIVLVRTVDRLEKVYMEQLEKEKRAAATSDGRRRRHRTPATICSPGRWRSCSTPRARRTL